MRDSWQNIFLASIIETIIVKRNTVDRVSPPKAESQDIFFLVFFLFEFLTVVSLMISRSVEQQSRSIAYRVVNLWKYECS